MDMETRVFEELVRSSTVGITIATSDEQPIILYANDAFVGLSGYGRDELIGQPARFLESSADNADGLAALRAAVGDERACTVLLQNTRKDGSAFWNEIHAFPVGNGSGGNARFAAIHRDVSARVIAERKLRSTNQTLRNLVIHDSLTGIYNRRFFDQMLQREWAIYTREQGPVSVLMLDIDDFKEFNDTHGHQAGDLCLQHVARCIDGTLRRGGDFVARYGGEEFVALLAGSRSDQAHHVALVVCDKIRSTPIPRPEKTAGPVGPLPSVTVSIGVATAVPERNSSADSVLALADGALYEAKSRGKNRVVVAGG